jgi:hypothetical protein
MTQTVCYVVCLLMATTNSYYCPQQRINQMALYCICRIFFCLAGYEFLSLVHINFKL